MEPEPTSGCIVRLPSFPPNLWSKIPFSLVQPSSHLTLCLYEKRSAQPDILIGTHEMQIPLASQSGSFVENPFSFDQLNISRADVPCVLGNGVGEAVRLTQPVILYITVNITQSREGMLPTSTKHPHIALHRADEAMKQNVPIDRSNAWERAVRRIKWVMDILSPIAEVRIAPFLCPWLS